MTDDVVLKDLVGFALSGLLAQKYDHHHTDLGKKAVEVAFETKAALASVESKSPLAGFVEFGALDEPDGNITIGSNIELSEFVLKNTPLDDIIPPDGYFWAAQDQNTRWYCYRNIPTLFGIVWDKQTGSKYEPVAFEAPNHKGNWDEALYHYIGCGHWVHVIL